jgi:hypothetical protein
MKFKYILISIVLLLHISEIAYATANESFIPANAGCNFEKGLPGSVKEVLVELKGLAAWAVGILYVVYMIKNFKVFMANRGEDGDAIKKKNAETNMLLITIAIVLIGPVVDYGLSKFLWYGSC